MARDSNGNYSLPTGTLVNSGDTVLPSQHNPAMNDIAAALSGSLARSGVGGMNGNLQMNGYAVLGVNRVESNSSVTAQGDLTGANLNLPATGQVRIGATLAFAYVGVRPTWYFDTSNNVYLQWAPDLTPPRFRLVAFGQVVANVLSGTAGAIFLGPVVQNGSPT